MNRELSWLQFNERVLELAEDERTPLIERVKFYAIYASNLDEFLMVRVAGLHDQVDAGIDARGADGLSPSETLEHIGERTARARAAATRACGTEELRPQLAEHGIRVIDCDQLRPTSSRRSTASSRSRSSRCSRHSPSARGGRSPTSRTSRCHSRSGCATPSPGPRRSRA